MKDRDARITSIKTLMSLLDDMEQELKSTSLRGEAFLAELHELRHQCDLELTLLEKRQQGPPGNDK
jgi:hypothetical protein